MHSASPVHNWDHWKPTVSATLMFIRDHERVLLIRKKRGLGMGKINGPGGKIDPGENALECAIRETQEELHVTPINPIQRGELFFQFLDGLKMHVSVFEAYQFTGTPTETAEAAPIWTPISAIPFDEMWADDEHWLQRMLQTQDRFIGYFNFDNDQMLTHELKWSH